MQTSLIGVSGLLIAMKAMSPFISSSFPFTFTYLLFVTRTLSTIPWTSFPSYLPAPLRLSSTLGNKKDLFRNLFSYVYLGPPWWRRSSRSSRYRDWWSWTAVSLPAESAPFGTGIERNHQTSLSMGRSDQQVSIGSSVR